jgi:acetyl esterase/lipase
LVARSIALSKRPNSLSSLTGEQNLVRVVRRLLLAVGLLLAGLIAGCGVAPPTVVFTLGTADRNLTYCNSQSLDLYVPRTRTVGELPVAMYVHGGGMTAGDKSDISPVFLNALTRAGYAVASVNYRLAPRFHFPAQIDDVKCAIRYLRAIGARYRLDGTKIFAFGTSVGGQLVALAALTGSRSPYDVGSYPLESSSVRAVVDLFGPANLTQPASGFSASDLQQVFGKGDHRDEILASPTHYVAPEAPPLLLIQGVDDTTVLESQSIELYRDLTAVGGRTQLLLVRHMGHMFMQVGQTPFEPNLKQIAHNVVGFFDANR